MAATFPALKESIKPMPEQIPELERSILMSLSIRALNVQPLELTRGHVRQEKGQIHKLVTGNLVWNAEISLENERNSTETPGSPGNEISR